MINNRVRIQLIDSNVGYLDVKEGTNFPITYGVAEVRDLTERKGTFSKSITLANTKNNARLLNHYFDINIVASTFNINTLQKCIVLEDNIPIVENAVMQLVAIKKVQKINAYDSEIEYTVLVKEATVDFYTKLGSSKLTDLSFPTYAHTYSSTAVVNSFAHTYTNGYKYVMPQSLSDNSYNLSEFQPGIYALNYWNNIFQSKGYTYDWPEMTDVEVQFDKLIIPFNGDTADLTQAQIDLLEVNATKSSVIQTTTNTTGTTTGSVLTFPITTWTELVDPSNDFDPTTGVYTNQLYTQGGNGLNFNITFDYEMQWINSSGGTAYLVEDTPSLNNASLRIKSRFGLITGSNLVGTAYITPLTDLMINEGTSVTNGTSFILQSNGSNMVGTTSVSMPYNIATIGQTFEFTLQTYANSIIASKWRTGPTTASPLADVQIRTSIRNVNLTITPTVNSVGFNFDINVDNYIPKEILQADFIKSIVTMYNLFIDIDPNEPNKLIIKSRDEYYDSGKTVNWTKQLNKNIDQNISWLAASQKKKLLLTYKQDNDQPNKGYYDATTEVYGQLEFTYDNEYIKDVDKKEIIFSPTPITLSAFGAITPAINGVAPKTNIRILYDGGMYTCSGWNIYDYGLTGQTNMTTYPYFGHFDKPVNPNFDINFGTCDFYYYDTFGNKTNNTLYNYHWRRTMNQLNKGHMLTAYFDLTAADIQKMDLNDKIRIDNAYYNINQIIDYNPTIVGPTKVELISIDSELEFVPFITKPVIATGTSDSVFDSIKDVERVRWTLNSLSSGLADVVGLNNTIGNFVLGGSVVGSNNIIVGGLKADISGANNIVTSDSILRGDNNIVNSKSMVIGSNNVVGEGLDNLLVIGDNIVPTTNGLWTNTINGTSITSIILWRPGSAGVNSIRTLSTFNDATGDDSICTGGQSTQNNLASGLVSVVMGGYNNTSAAAGSGTYGGTLLTNASGANWSVLLGGVNNQNTTTGSFSAIVAGQNNINNGYNCAIIVGDTNVHISTSQLSVILGGTNNTISAVNAFTLGGTSLTVSGNNSGAMGVSNIVSGLASFVIGSNSVVASEKSLAVGDSHLPTSAAIASLSYGTNTIATTYGERVAGIGNLSGLNAQEGTINLSQTTINATTTDIVDGVGNVGIDIPVGTAWIMTIQLQATITSATNQSNTRTFEEKVRVKNVAGVLTAVSLGTIYVDGGELGTTTFAINTVTFTGTRWRIQLTGALTTNVSWLAKVDYTKIRFV